MPVRKTKSKIKKLVPLSVFQKLSAADKKAVTNLSKKLSRKRK